MPSQREEIFDREGVLAAIGVAVRALRTAKGYSQEGFADACGIDRSYMGGIERGQRNPSTVNLMRIIEALDMKPSEFFKHLEKAAKPQQ